MVAILILMVGSGKLFSILNDEISVRKRVLVNHIVDRFMTVTSWGRTQNIVQSRTILQLEEMDAYAYQ